MRTQLLGLSEIRGSGGGSPIQMPVLFGIFTMCLSRFNQSLWMMMVAGDAAEGSFTSAIGPIAGMVEGLITGRRSLPGDAFTFDTLHATAPQE
jgi:hypothetical protein